MCSHIYKNIGKRSIVVHCSIDMKEDIPALSIKNWEIWKEERKTSKIKLRSINVPSA
jgi:hypothetical protein